MLRDLRYACRVLRRAPVFAATSILTLAVCIGANAAIYAVVDRVLVRPLPYPEPDRLALIATHINARGADGDDTGQVGAVWETLRDNATSVEVATTAGSFGGGVNLVVAGAPYYVRQQRVSAGFFHVLGVAPAAGREFNADEDRPSGPSAVILSDALWRRLFAGDRSVVGQSVTLAGEPHAIVGVMPAGFQSGADADLWIPVRASRAGEGGGQNYDIIARLRPGVTWAEADAQVASLGGAIVRDVYRAPGVSARLGIVPLQRGQTADVRRPLLIVWAAVAVVLVIGCVNVAGLLLARGAERRGEIAARMALGAGQRAVVRQLLAEALVLAACGGAGGLAIGQLSAHVFQALLSDAFGVREPATLDLRVMAIAAAIALGTSIVFGLLPAIRATRIDVRQALVDSGSRSIGGASTAWPRRALVVTQVALGVTLVVSAGLLVRTLEHLTSLASGFDSGNVVTATASLQDARYTTAEQVDRLYTQTLERVHEVPSVERAAVALTLPYERALNMGGRLVGARTGIAQPPFFNLTYVTPEYFDALRVPLRRGRSFVGTDNRAGAPVVVVNDAFVRRYLGGDDPIGLQLVTAGATRTIVGVVGDIQQKASFNGFAPVAPMPAAYIPASQLTDEFVRLVHTWFSPSWIVRLRAPDAAIAAEMQRAVERVDPQFPFAKFRTIDDVRGDAVALQRGRAILLVSLAVIALLLAAVGAYGLVASSVTVRTRELGIRMALGATPLRTFLDAASPAVVLAAVGIALGIALARAAGRLLSTLVWGISVDDPATFLTATAVVALVTAIAIIAPSGRVLRLNPIRALRD